MDFVGRQNVLDISPSVTVRPLASGGMVLVVARSPAYARELAKRLQGRPRVVLCRRR